MNIVYMVIHSDIYAYFMDCQTKGSINKVYCGIKKGLANSANNEDL